jgi:hypothetical protein
VAVDSSFPLLRRIRAGPPGIYTCLADKPSGDRILLAPVSRAQLRRLGAVPPCLPASHLGSAAVLVPCAPAVEAITMLPRKPRMTGTRALIAVGIAGIEQRSYNSVRCGLVHLGAGHEVTRVAVGQTATLSLALRLETGALLPIAAKVDDVEVSHAAQRTLSALVKHPIFGRAPRLSRRLPVAARWRTLRASRAEQIVSRDPQRVGIGQVWVGRRHPVDELCRGGAASQRCLEIGEVATGFADLSAGVIVGGL